jgi:voltage-gated potassium channel
MSSSPIAIEPGRDSRRLTLKERLYLILESPHPSDPLAHRWSWFITVLILANAFAVVMGTVEPIGRRFEPVLLVLEVMSIAIFAAEYVIRLWVITCSPRYAHPLFGRLRFAVSPLALVDLLAIAPALLAARIDLRFVRLARLARLARVLKLARYSRALGVIARVLRRRREELVVALSGIAILLVVAASLMYYAERHAQPDTFSSIPAALWWAVTTITTVGYGDVYPVTTAGRVLAGLVALCGIGAFALPTSILGAAFLSEFDRAGQRQICPKCGTAL